MYFSPRRLYTSETVRQAGLGARRLRMSSQHSFGGGDLGGLLGNCPLLYLSDTAWLGQAHGHRILAVGVWRGDGPFRYELPNKIPVLKANSTSQMDEVGG